MKIFVLQAKNCKQNEEQLNCVQFHQSIALYVSKSTYRLFYQNFFEWLPLSCLYVSVVEFPARLKLANEILFDLSRESDRPFSAKGYFVDFRTFP